jgi:hypothetical protein
LSAVPYLSRRGCGYVATPQIDTNNLGSFACWWGIKFNGDVDVKVPISSFNQRGTGGRLPVEQCSLVVADQQLERVSFINQRYSNFLRVRMIDKRSGVQADTGRTKLPNLFGGLQIAQYSTNRLTNVIRFQTSCFSHRLISQVMQLSGVVALMQLSRYQNLMASIRKSLHRAVNRWLHVIRDLKLTRYRQGLSHVSILLHQARPVVHPAPLSSPSAAYAELGEESGKNR